MKKIAVALSLAALALAGYLAWMNLHQMIEVVSSGEVKTVRVDNFAYGTPKLVKPENLKVEPLKVEPPAEHSSVVQSATNEINETVATLESVDEANLEGLTCVVFGPVPEKSLPKHRYLFEKFDLIRKLTIIPYRDLGYAVYVGPLTREKARMSLRELCKDAPKSCSIMELKAGGYALVVKTFSDKKVAELWSKKFAFDNNLTNVRVTRYNNVADSRVVLVFNGVGDDQVKTLFKRSKSEKLGLSVCPKGL